MLLSKTIFNSTSLPKISTGYFILFLIWPFAVFVSSLRKFRVPQSKTIFWLFCIYFGLVFIVAEDKVEAADSARYAQQLKELHQETLSFTSLSNLLYTEGGFIDLYQPVVTWAVACFTDNPKVLFAFFAAVFGFFYVQNLWIVFSRIQNRISFLLLLFLLAMALANPIWNINGARMWTAAHIFLYGVLNIYLNKDKKGYLWAIVSVFVHFSFLFPVVLIIIYAFIPKNVIILFVFYVASSFVNEINYEGLGNALDLMPEVFQPKMRGYINEQYTQQIRENIKLYSWHVVLAQYTKNFILYFWIFISFYYFKYWSKKLFEAKDLYFLSLYLGGFAKLASLIPSGGRFLIISDTIFFILFILIFSNNKFFRTRLFWQKRISYPPLLFYLLFSFRTGMEFFGFLLFFGNPLFGILLNDKIPLIFFLKKLL